MKYELEIEINLPRKDVVTLFENPDNMPKWQPGFVSMEHLEGEPGKTGAKSKLLYKMGKREIEMIETITHSHLPEEFHGTYDAKGVHNKIWNYFTEKDEETTIWKSVNEFQFQGFMKLMGWLMPSAFKKQSLKYMKDFKAFAESEGREMLK
jgi:hypothetical protein